MAVAPRVAAALAPKVVVELKVAAVAARALVFLAATGPAQPANRLETVVVMRLPETQAAK